MGIGVQESQQKKLQNAFHVKMAENQSSLKEKKNTNNDMHDLFKISYISIFRKLKNLPSLQEARGRKRSCPFVTSLTAHTQWKMELWMCQTL